MPPLIVSEPMWNAESPHVHETTRRDNSQTLRGIVRRRSLVARAISTLVGLPGALTGETWWMAWVGPLRGRSTLAIL